MEKITHQPFIHHLKAEEAYYEHLLVEYEVKHGIVPGDAVSDWMVNVIQPLILELAGEDEQLISKLGKVFFKELLRLLQTGNLSELAHVYKKAWLLTADFKNVFISSPVKVLLALSSAIHSIYTYQSQRLNDWLDLMKKLLPGCKTLNDVLSVGRIASWISGMAHLRASAWQNYEHLSNELKQLIQINYRGDTTFEESIHSPWKYKGDTSLESFGGFMGLTHGLFKNPPKVALKSDCIMATDGETTCAFFADRCGKVVLNNISIDPEHIINASNCSHGNTLKNEYSDITSMVMMEDLIVFTRESSFKVFINS